MIYQESFFFNLLKKLKYFDFVLTCFENFVLKKWEQKMFGKQKHNNFAPTFFWSFKKIWEHTFLLKANKFFTNKLAIKYVF